MKVYLAGPFCKPIERANVERAKDILKSRNLDLFVPMEHFIEGGEDMPNNVWGQKVFKMDKEAIFQCDIVIALYYGLYSDSGTAWEIGFANAINKKIVIVHCDKESESSLMVVNGSTINIANIEELSSLDFDNLYGKNFYSHIAQK